MFNFIMKRSEVVLDCFTSEYNTFEFFKIAPSSKFIPKWWRNLPNSVNLPNPHVGEAPSPTMKGCVGFTNYFSNGFIIPLWSDLIVKSTEKTYNYQFSCKTNSMSEHHTSQSNNAFSCFHHIKMESPWIIKCKENIQFYWAPAFWSFATNENFVKNFWIIPGILDFKINHFTNVNLFLNKTENSFFINAGFPLVHLVPITDKKVILKHHLIDTNHNIASGNTPFFTFMHRKLGLLRK